VFGTKLPSLLSLDPRPRFASLRQWTIRRMQVVKSAEIVIFIKIFQVKDQAFADRLTDFQNGKFRCLDTSTRVAHLGYYNLKPDEIA
jgi:hypothetical protein